MWENLLSLGRILIFDVLSILSLIAMVLAVFLPIIAMIEFIQLVRTARTASWHAIASRSRGGWEKLRFRPVHPGVLEMAKRLSKVTPESSKAA